MKIQAAVTWEKDAPFAIQQLELAEPRSDELLVRLVSTGVCHTDLSVMHQQFPVPLPYVLGHEGAGIVEQVGSSVEGLAVGDKVVLSYESCGACSACGSGHPAYCDHYATRNFGRQRSDGGAYFHDQDGTALAGRFLGQSSFATHVIATPRNAIKVRPDAPLEMLGGFGCGFMTGAAAVMNVGRPAAGSSFAALGAGALGFAAMFAARLAGCTRILMVDRVAQRLALARELGATHVIDTGKDDLAAALADFGAIDNVVDTTGFGPVVAEAIKMLGRRGTLILLGGSGSPIAEVNIVALLQGRVLRGEIFGDADPHAIIPKMIDLFLAGDFPVDRLIRHYSFAEINQAAADASSGATIKPVLLF